MNFELKDSYFIAFGKWSIKNENTLILIIDSSIFNSKTTRKVQKIDLTIKEDRLFWKGISRKEYRKSKRVSKKFLQEGPLYEVSYLEVKKKQQNKYLEKTLTFNCEGNTF